MIWRIIKGLLSGAKVSVIYQYGDQVEVFVSWHGHTLVDRVVDIIPGA